MKYKVIAIYKYEGVIDTDSVGFKHYKNSPMSVYDKNEKAMVESYAQRQLSYSIVDDEGHGTIYPYSLDWTTELIK